MPVTGFDVVMGTSAGSVAGAWLTMRPEGLAQVPEKMREHSLSRVGALRSRKSGVDTGLVQRALDRAAQRNESALSVARAAVATMSPISAGEAERAWRAALPEGTWPPHLKVTAVDARTGLAGIWSARDAVPPAVAVSASTAAPGVAPPVRIAGTVWVDGGVRSNTNADLLLELAGDEEQERADRATELGNVLILAPRPTDNLPREEQLLVDRGRRVRVITATPFYRTRADLLDPRTIDTAATIGAVQARDLATELVAWLSR